MIVMLCAICVRLFDCFWINYIIFCFIFSLECSVFVCVHMVNLSHCSMCFIFFYLLSFDKNFCVFFFAQWQWCSEWYNGIIFIELLWTLHWKCKTKWNKFWKRWHIVRSCEHKLFSTRFQFPRICQSLEKFEICYKVDDVSGSEKSSALFCSPKFHKFREFYDVETIWCNRLQTRWRCHLMVYT